MTPKHKEGDVEVLVDRLLKELEDGRMSRRQLIQTLALAATAGAAATGAGAQTVAAFRTVRIDHVSCQVADYRRTRDFYAGLMGMAVEGDNGKDYCQLQFGDVHNAGARARTFLSVTSLGPQAGQDRSGIDHLAFSIENWDSDRVRTELERCGLTPRLQPGGAGDTPNDVSFHVTDPDGLGVQISGIARPGDSLYKRP
jgi:catechol 2,3-dioxygenase-like lactoylglutathione lyase family enzyme